MNNIWYHGTDSVFREFTYNDDIGFHFGTLDQATTRLTDKQISTPILMKVEINLNNPIRIRDISNFTIHSLKYELEYNPIFADKLSVLNSIDDINELRDYIYSLGYDGFIYRNEKEVPSANELINESNYYFDMFLAQTNSHKFKILDEHKQNCNYIKYMELENKIADTIKKDAQDSIIVFYNHQITILE